MPSFVGLLVELSLICLIVDFVVGTVGTVGHLFGWWSLVQ